MFFFGGGGWNVYTTSPPKSSAHALLSMFDFKISLMWVHESISPQAANIGFKKPKIAVLEFGGEKILGIFREK